MNITFSDMIEINGFNIFKVNFNLICFKKLIYRKCILYNI